MQVKDVMTEDPICCAPDTPLTDVARLMARNDCGAIPVVDDKETMRPIGVITDRDIVVRAVAHGLDAADTAAGDVMSDGCVTVSMDDPIEVCCGAMEAKQVRRVLVTDGNGRCCGIVAQADIARHVSQEATGEVLREISH